MGHVGNAVCHNLLRKGYTVTAITDIKPDNCKGFPESIAVKGTAREVAELSDIVVSGKGHPQKTSEYFRGGGSEIPMLQEIRG